MGMQVGPHIWLGRAWVVNPIEAWQPFAVDPVVKPIVDTAFQVENATWIGTLAATGIEGPLSSATTSGGHYPTLVRPACLSLLPPPSLSKPPLSRQFARST